MTCLNSSRMNAAAEAQDRGEGGSKSSIRTLVITGASSGLGCALAREFRSHGFRVIAVSRRRPGDGVCDEFIPADLTIPAELHRAAEEVRKLGFGVDVLINNAGIGSYAKWEELSDADLRREFEIDFFAPVALTRELLPEVAASRGTVINISSAAAWVPVACMGAYNAAKAALRMFSLTLQMEVRGRGIHVLNVCPGRIDTGFSTRALGGRTVPETPGRRASSATRFAARVYRAWQRRKRELFYPWWYRIVAEFVRYFPGVCEAGNRRVWRLNDAD